jgi:hypothetical protein
MMGIYVITTKEILERIKNESEREIHLGRVAISKGSNMVYVFKILCIIEELSGTSIAIVI